MRSLTTKLYISQEINETQYEEEPPELSLHNYCLLKQAGHNLKLSCTHIYIKHFIK